jgi:hypothetical protein
MERRFSIILIATSLLAGCATPPKSETHEIASDILKGRSGQTTCPDGAVPYCATGGSRINSARLNTHCGCIAGEEFRGSIRAP